MNFSGWVDKVQQEGPQGWSEGKNWRFSGIALNFHYTILPEVGLPDLQSWQLVSGLGAFEDGRFGNGENSSETHLGCGVLLSVQSTCSGLVFDGLGCVCGQFVNWLLRQYEAPGDLLYGLCYADFFHFQVPLGVFTLVLFCHL